MESVSELMQSIIREIYPNGMPSNEDILMMTKDQKDFVFQQNKLIIKAFREKADEHIAELQKQLSSINNTETNMSISQDKIALNPLPPIKEKHNAKNKGNTNSNFAPCLKYKNDMK